MAKVDVCITVVYHNTVTIEVDDPKDEIAMNYAARKAVYSMHKHMDDEGWCEDEFEVIPE